jgi:uncharacterized protein (DUF885 family)
MLSACATHQEQPQRGAAAPPAGETQLDNLIRDFTAGYYRFNPDVAISNGLHQYDGRIPDFSAQGIRQYVAWLEQMRTRARAIDPGTLDARQYLYLQQLETAVDSILFVITDMKAMENNPWYGYSGIDPDIYLTRDYAPPAQRIQAYIRHVQAIPAAVSNIKNNLRPLSATLAYLWKTFTSGLAEYITTVPAHVFAEVNDPELQEQMKTADERAALVLNDLSRWIDTLPVRENFALGEQRYTRMLWTFERINTPLPELRRLAQRDLQQNLDALEQACGQYLPGASVRDCMHQVSSNKPAEGPVTAATRDLALLRKLIVDRHIVTIPGEDTAIVAEAPPHQRSNSAYISRPGPYEKNVPAIFYIAPPDPAWNAEEQYQYIPERSMLMNIAVHEVWPGHFLEGLYTNRSGNPVSDLYTSYAFAEGWAHYVEEMMVREGFGNAPEARISQLKDALLRDVRFISSLGLHTGGMTVQESEQLFLGKAFQDPGNARQQAARGTFDPGYLFYTVGKLMIKKLRDDWLTLHPDKSLQQFHDTLLSFGAAPIPLIRKQMLGDADDGQLFKD